MVFEKLDENKYGEELKEWINKYNTYMERLYPEHRFYVEKRIEMDKKYLGDKKISLSVKIMMIKAIIGE